MRVDVAYTEDGPDDAPVVVRSDPLGSTQAMWDAQVLAFAERFITHDTRGHRRSPGAIQSAELPTGALLGHFDAAGATR